jgi:aspartyl-tRNA(Asn)/glutamyl-tRNA(Gln) amidotransferase subunit A
MTTVAPTELGAADLATAIRARRISARETTDAFLKRIAAVDGALGSYYRVDSEGARVRAAAIDGQIGRGEDPGPLAGVPIALKDLFVTKGIETTAGSKILEGWVPPYDGTVVRKLEKAGAIMLGKTAMDEFAMGSSNENSAYGITRNPWDSTRVPGGSSGGSAAAVAADLCAAALGTDTGGSIRQPAAFCGVTGVKPTYGRVSRYGVIAFASSLDQPGPLGHSARDCALLLEVIAGVDPHDATALDKPVPDYRAACQRDVAGLRIGVPTRWLDRLDPAMAAVFGRALDDLVALGARRVDVELPMSEHGIAAYYIIATAEASSNLSRYDGVRYGLRVDAASLSSMYSRTRDAGFGDEAKRRIMLGTYALRSGYYDAYYLRAQKVRTLIRDELARAFEQCDVIASPTAPTTAFALGANKSDPLAMYLNDIFTIPCNLAGIPGISLPCGFLDGLPVGLQLLAAPLAEETLFAFGGAYQRQTDWHARRPELPGLAHGANVADAAAVGATR